MSKIVTLMILDTEEMTEWKRTTMYEDISGEGFTTDDYIIMLNAAYEKLSFKFDTMAGVNLFDHVSENNDAEV